jgi:hypothetical protein
MVNDRINQSSGETLSQSDQIDLTAPQYEVASELTA